MKKFFSGTRPGKMVSHGGARFELPVLYLRDDVFYLLFTAEPERVRRAMPSDRLHPVMVPGGRCLVGVAAFNYQETSIGPYGEVGVVAPAVHGIKPPPVLLPLLLEARHPGFGYVVLHLPVTRKIARDAGRGEWGYAKFVADMVFTTTPEYLECRMDEEGRHILTLRVARRGVCMADRKPLVTFSVREGVLIKTIIPQKGLSRTAFRPGGSFLALGDHPVAQSIRDLGVGSVPLMSRYYLERAGILPSGVPLEQGVRPLEGYLGTDREGRHQVNYGTGEGP